MAHNGGIILATGNKGLSHEIFKIAFRKTESEKTQRLRKEPSCAGIGTTTKL